MPVCRPWVAWIEVQVLEIIVVSGEDNQAVPDSMKAMAWVGGADQRHICRNNDLVTRPP